MSENRKNYTIEFKKQIILLYNNGKSRRNIVKEYDIPASTLHKWIKNYNSTKSFLTKDNRTKIENELIILKKENKQLKMENDILKQAALILGQK
jgi:transposase